MTAITRTEQDAPRLHRLDANLGAGERIVATLGGGALVAFGLPRRTVGGALMAAVGAGLIAHGVKSNSAVYRWLGATPEDVGASTHPFSREFRARRSVTIARPAAELYSAWRDLERLPRFMRRVESIDVLDEQRSRWTVRFKGGERTSWIAEITEDRENERIAWETTEGRLICHRGSVEFLQATGNRGTVVRGEIIYTPVGGVFGALASKLLRADPDAELREDLRRFKQLMETGEVAVAEAPSGRAEEESRQRPRVPRRDIDVVEESSEESFPASDAPAYTHSRM